MISSFFEGVLLSATLIMPLGVQNLFIFNQGASHTHLRYALPSVLTAFVCDAFLIISAILGVSMIILTMPTLKILLVCLGILFLFYMGVHAWLADEHLSTKRHILSPMKQIGFAASVSLLNPHAWLDAIVVIGSYSIHYVGLEKILFTLGCLCISLSWFVGLSIAGHISRRSTTILCFINRISAVFMWTVALYLLGQLLCQ